MIRDYGVARVRSAVAEDAAKLAPILRPEDLREIAAFPVPTTPEEALSRSIRLSTQSYAIELPSGELVALFGVAPTQEPKLGAVWLLGSARIQDIRIAFLRHSKEWLQKLFADYSLLGNFCDARNTLHIEWLRWLGFRFLRKLPLGRGGEMLMEFVRLKE